MSQRVVVIGGGLAGIAAAVRLADAGHVPIVLETRRKLGGRATSFPDQRSGRALDNCQHVLMGCCTALLSLYERLGVSDRIEWHERLYWFREDGGCDLLKPGLLPAPLHTAGGFLRMKLLDRAAKSEIRRAMWRMLRGGHRLRSTWRDQTFGDFLQDQRQSPETTRLFWDTIIISACNLPSSEVAAEHGMQVFQEAFLPSRWAGTMGLPTVPLASLYDPAESIIRDAGGELRLGCSVREICTENRKAVGVMTSDEMVRGDAIVSTVPPDRLAKLLPDEIRSTDRRLQGLDQFEFSPILGVHLHFDAEVMDRPHLILAGRNVHWIFNKGFDEEGRHHLHVVISAADDWMELDEETIVNQVMEEIRRALPGAVDQDPVTVRAIKEKRATFRATPEIEPCRPTSAPGSVGLQGGDIDRLYLGGDWCATGWPATMEGAVRSGYIAAAAINGTDSGIEEVPAGRLAGWLGLSSSHR
ncbi:MAG: hydroxysqualene dehydroxylase HpnE [Phycisphaerales bacterium]|nr:hydroxysqualene dehydroxylase HpnE [Phycisphaerales bacterium]